RPTLYLPIPHNRCRDRLAVPILEHGRNIHGPRDFIIRAERGICAPLARKGSPRGHTQVALKACEGPPQKQRGALAPLARNPPPPLERPYLRGLPFRAGHRAVAMPAAVGRPLPTLPRKRGG